MTIGTNTIAEQHLRSAVERLEKIKADRTQLGDDEKVILAEAKALGLSPKHIKGVVKIRAMRPHDRADDEAMMDMYLHAMGLANEPPLFRYAKHIGQDSLATKAIADALGQMLPPDGTSAEIVSPAGKRIRIWRDKDGKVHHEEVVATKKNDADFDEVDDAPKAKRPTKPAAPDVDEDGAYELGRTAARENQPVITNPFPFGDPRRARFDEGWRKETGNDGMGPQEE